MHSADVSVIVCTRDRPASLVDTLTSLANLVLPQGLRAELIIVHNGTAGETSRVVDRFMREPRLPTYYLYDRHPGLARARNRGLRASRGTILAFTDDDCVVDRYWLAHLAAEFDAHPDVPMVFGRTRLAAGSAVALSVKDDPARRLYAYPTPPWAIGHGNNMAFRRTLVEQVGEFDERMGAGTPVGAASDTEYAFRVLRRGYQILYTPAPLVWHDLSRRTPEDLDRVLDASARGRGAFYCKFLLRGDRWAGTMLAAELRRHARAAVARRSRRRRAWRNLTNLCRGVLLRLRDEL